MAGQGSAPVKRPSILVVDDERLIRWSIAAELEERGYEAREADSLSRAREELSRGVDLVVLDLDLSAFDAQSLLAEAREQAPNLPVIVLTGQNGQTAATVKEQATRCLEKPFEPRQIGAVVEGLCRRAGANDDDADQHSARALARLKGQSEAMERLRATLASAARASSRAVLITGESGSGRHLAARALHELSDRANGPLRVLVGSHASRSAFDAVVTECAGGTLLVEGLEALTDEAQEGLLQFLETPSDVRIVVLAGRDLTAALSGGTLRRSLVEMLRSTRIEVPALREREGDIALLAHYFVTKLSGLLDTKVRAIDESAIAALERHDWPGNVRELRDTVERAMLIACDETLTADDFQPLGNGVDPAATYTLPPGGIDLKELERNLVIQALARTGGNRTRAAELLRMTRDQMRYRVAKFNLD